MENEKKKKKLSINRNVVLNYHPLITN